MISDNAKSKRNDVCAYTFSLCVCVSVTNSEENHDLNVHGLKYGLELITDNRVSTY